MGSAPTIEDLSSRLHNAAHVARDADDVAKTERERRDRLVVDAIREGVSYRQVTELTGLSRTRIIAIIANSG